MQRQDRPYLMPALLVAITFLGLFALFHFAGKSWNITWSEAPPSERVAMDKDDSKQSAEEETKEVQSMANVPKMSESAGAWMTGFLAQWLKLEEELTKRGAIQNEALVSFNDQAAYEKFLAEAGAAGLKIKGQDGKNLTVRVSFDKSSDLRKYLVSNPDLGASVAANYFVSVPEVPVAADRSNSSNVPFRTSGLEAIGAGNNPKSGQGVKLAILDSAISPESVFGQRLLYGQLANDPTSDLSHATSVASIAGGQEGVAPASTLLSVGVVGADGMSDSFTLGQGIRYAVENGAKVLNISLGSYGNSEYLAAQVAYAQQQGSVVVASNGNDGYTNSTYPARYPGVIAVGAMDAYGQVVSFSNSSENYGLTAPGLEVNAWVPGGQQEAFSGTSAAAPFVAGSIAAVMSSYPGMSARQAADLIIQYANDAGAPGPDPDYGNGIVNLQRVYNRNVPNLNDLAVTANYLDPNAAGGPQLVYVVQNQGTMLANQWPLETVMNGFTQDFTIPLLKPNEVASFAVPVDASALSAGITIYSRVTPPSGTTDSSQQNNARKTTILLK